ncbi:MFS transporter [Burkholderia mayonis]|uniref:MFS transporter n=2 Tax=Burkholderia mayonis TaxID=1385591 RepID=A0A1B4FT19_9BURK|nr:MFS transporter [Burkholderia mayonis]KVE57661.1 MFS transporter [Burkholderia mayonis]
MPARRGSSLALVVAHVAGMIDLVALPVWVGALIQHYGFDAQQAGLLATLYLGCAVLCCSVLARRFDRISGRLVAPTGFAVGALAFLAATQAHGLGPMAAAHALAGAGVGCGLSCAHGEIGLARNPHRLFAFSHLALSGFGVLFFATVPALVARDGSAIFTVLAALAGCAALATGLLFPGRAAPGDAAVESNTPVTPHAPLDARCWCAIIGIVFMAINQAMVFGFVERIGMARGFGADHVNAVLLAVGLVNLLPPALAALLQHRLDARTVAVAGPLTQAVLALAIARSTSFAPYAFGVSLWVFAMIFTHTFLFGLLARLDATGRAVASTPAMLMSGSAVGPLLGGVLIVRFGFDALGTAVAIVSLLSLLFLVRLRVLTRRSPALSLSEAP